MGNEFQKLERYLLEQSLRCLRPAAVRFRHAWLAPMPLSSQSALLLKHMERGESPAGWEGSESDFTTGDYSLGLFHHDASEASIELLQHPQFRDAAAGSLLNLLDTAAPNGCVHRVELPHKRKENEPSKPVIAQYALRCAQALGPDWALEHDVLSRVERFLDFCERTYGVGGHGLFLVHSSLQSGFDNDLLTMGAEDGTVESPDVNAFMVLEYDACAALAQLLGKEGTQWTAKADTIRSRMEQLLWHPDGYYVALIWKRSGSPRSEIRSAHGRPMESWTSYLPLYAGVPSPDRAKQMVARLTREEGFWGPHGVRTLPKDSEYFSQSPRYQMYDQKKNSAGPASNWQGPYWVLSNYYLAEGLARYGRADLAADLTQKTARLLQRSLEGQGQLFECYGDDGSGLWPRRETFLSWNVLVITLVKRHLPRE